MCTSIVFNGKKTIVGWNLDILDMKHRVRTDSKSVVIEIYDKKEGWMPLFGANANGDFVAMPTCWPYDEKSDPKESNANNILLLDIDLLTGKKSFEEIKNIVETQTIYSIPGITFQAQLSNHDGDVLQIIPGQGYRYLLKPQYSVLTNFSPFKMDREIHPWMGIDRYKTAIRMLENKEELAVEECFEILQETSQTFCPTVVSMVFDVTERTVYWNENRSWNQIKKKKLDYKFGTE